MVTVLIIFGILIVGIILILIIGFSGTEDDLRRANSQYYRNMDDITMLRRKVNALQDEADTIGEYCDLKTRDGVAVFHWIKYKQSDISDKVDNFVKIGRKWIPEGLIINYNKALLAPVKRNIEEISIRCINTIEKNKKKLKKS